MDEILEFIGGWITSTLQILVLFLYSGIVMAVMGLVFALPLMWSWNATMPYLFGLSTITYIKAWCLYLLAGFLIKGGSSTVNKVKEN